MPEPRMHSFQRSDLRNGRRHYHVGAPADATAFLASILGIASETEEWGVQDSITRMHARKGALLLELQCACIIF